MYKQPVANAFTVTRVSYSVQHLKYEKNNNNNNNKYLFPISSHFLFCHLSHPLKGKMRMSKDVIQNIKGKIKKTNKKNQLKSQKSKHGSYKLQTQNLKHTCTKHNV